MEHGINMDKFTVTNYLNFGRKLINCPIWNLCELTPYLQIYQLTCHHLWNLLEHVHFQLGDDSCIPDIRWAVRTHNGRRKTSVQKMFQNVPNVGSALRDGPQDKVPAAVAHLVRLSLVDLMARWSSPSLKSQLPRHLPAEHIGKHYIYIHIYIYIFIMYIYNIIIYTYYT